MGKLQRLLEIARGGDCLGERLAAFFKLRNDLEAHTFRGFHFDGVCLPVGERAACEASNDFGDLFIHDAQIIHHHQ